MRKIIKLSKQPTDGYEVTVDTLVNLPGIDRTIKVRWRDMILTDFGKPMKDCFKLNDYEFTECMKKTKRGIGFYPFYLKKKKWRKRRK